jgi:SAM-dependent methyltransferase
MAIFLITALFIVIRFLPPVLKTTAIFILSAAIAGIIISLSVSWYIYDHTDLYSLNWLDRLNIGENKQLVNINAGFDETSSILVKKFPGSKLLVFDFYDPSLHTEISIERARKAYPAFPGTIKISTGNIPLQPNSVDYIFLLFAAHEIRNDKERTGFFSQLGNALRPGGKIIVTEHYRDIYNFIAYTIGFFHFYSARSWMQTFDQAGLYVEKTFKLNPFISTFVLKKNGTAS